MLRKKSFTLIEIMVVVAIVGILLALALPQFLRSRISANETAAIANLRLINNACQAYYANINPHSYPLDGLSDLISPVSEPPYIDNILASGTKQGYEFKYKFIDAEHFQVYANPVYPGRTGVRYFFVDETGVIRANSTQEAGPDDPPVP